MSRRSAEICLFLIAGGLILFILFSFRWTDSTPKTETSHSKEFCRPSERMINVYEKQVSNRRFEYSRVVKETDHFMEVYNNLAPEAFCMEMIKVGTTGDGGKWFCNPFDIPKDSLLLSLGLNGEISFEKHLQEINGNRCRIMGFDSAEQTAEIQQSLREINGKSEKAIISNITRPDQNLYSINALVEKFQLGNVEILKMDVEGAEIYSLEDFLDRQKPAQLFIEVHTTPKMAVDFLRMVASKGYLALHYEINGIFPKLFEISFIHTDAMERYGATRLARFLV